MRGGAAWPQNRNCFSWLPGDPDCLNQPGLDTYWSPSGDDRLQNFLEYDSTDYPWLAGIHFQPVGQSGDPALLPIENSLLLEHLSRLRTFVTLSVLMLWSLLRSGEQVQHLSWLQQADGHFFYEPLASFSLYSPFWGCARWFGYEGRQQGFARYLTIESE